MSCSANAGPHYCIIRARLYKGHHTHSCPAPPASSFCGCSFVLRSTVELSFPWGSRAVGGAAVRGRCSAGVPSASPFTFHQVIYEKTMLVYALLSLPYMFNLLFQTKAWSSTECHISTWTLTEANVRGHGLGCRWFVGTQSILLPQTVALFHAEDHWCSVVPHTLAIFLHTIQELRALSLMALHQTWILERHQQDLKLK